MTNNKLILKHLLVLTELNFKTFYQWGHWSSKKKKKIQYLAQSDPPSPHDRNKVCEPTTHPAKPQGRPLAGMGVNGFGGGSGGWFASLREHFPFPGPHGGLVVKWI